MVNARHSHRFGGCEGVLRFFRDGVEYDAFEHDKDDRAWSYAELRDFSWDPPKRLKLTEGERDALSLGLKHHDWRFDLDEPLPPEALMLLERKVYR
jgi:hypothetical protein